MAQLAVLNAIIGWRVRYIHANALKFHTVNLDILHKVFLFKYCWFLKFYSMVLSIKESDKVVNLRLFPIFGGSTTSACQVIRFLCV